jgi:hypothetical protein
MTDLVMWTIYEKPKDYPNGFVVRRSVVSDRIKMDVVAQYSPTLLHARAAIPRGLHRLPRFPDDDACVVEVWM